MPRTPRFTPPLWRCPKCGTLLVTGNVAHSCGRATIADLKGKMGPRALAIYRRLERLIAAAAAQAGGRSAAAACLTRAGTGSPHVRPTLWRLSGLPWVLLAPAWLAACASGTSVFERQEFVVNGQAMEVLTARALFARYLRDRSRYPDDATASRDLLFSPIAREMIDDRTQAPFMFAAVAVPYAADSTLLREVARFGPSDIAAIVSRSMPAITESLPGPHTRILVLPASPSMRPYLIRYHVAGYGVTLGAGKIIVAVDPSQRGWELFLAYAVAHEYHHSAWISKHWVSPNFTLLQYLVFEGRADNFAKSVNPGFEIPADRYLSEDRERAVWDLVRPRLQQTGREPINEVMNGTADIPFGSGYTIGYHIVSAFRRRHPGYADRQVTDVEPAAILDSSGYFETPSRGVDGAGRQ